MDVGVVYLYCVVMCECGDVCGVYYDCEFVFVFYELYVVE